VPHVLRQILAIDLNNLALQFRKLRRMAEAESLLRRALAIDEKARGEAHPKIPHRLNNICTALIMQGKLDEAKELLARAWQLKCGRHDLTSARLLFVRLTVAMLESQPETLFLGQLKTLLAQESLPDHADVVKVWDIAYFIDHLSAELGGHHAAFLRALAASLNDRAKLPELDRFPQWRDAPPQSLE
jgi:tetratricopeptide (TPR) repeat protein